MASSDSITIGCECSCTPAVSLGRAGPAHLVSEPVLPTQSRRAAYGGCGRPGPTPRPGPGSPRSSSRGDHGSGCRQGRHRRAPPGPGGPTRAGPAGGRSAAPSTPDPVTSRRPWPHRRWPAARPWQPHRRAPDRAAQPQAAFPRRATSSMVSSTITAERGRSRPSSEPRRSPPGLPGDVLAGRALRWWDLDVLTPGPSGPGHDGASDLPPALGLGRHCRTRRLRIGLAGRWRDAARLYAGRRWH